MTACVLEILTGLGASMEEAREPGSAWLVTARCRYRRSFP